MPIMFQTIADKISQLPRPQVAEQAAKQAVYAGPYRDDHTTVYEFNDRSLLEVNFLANTATALDRVAAWLWSMRIERKHPEHDIIDAIKFGDSSVPPWIECREEPDKKTVSLWDVATGSPGEGVPVITLIDDREEFSLDDDEFETTLSQILDDLAKTDKSTLYYEINQALACHGAWLSGKMSTVRIKSDFGINLVRFCQDPNDLFVLEIKDGVVRVSLADPDPRLLLRLEIKCSPTSSWTWTEFARAMIVGAATAAVAKEDPIPEICFSSFYDVVLQVRAFSLPEPPLVDAWVKTLVLRRFVFGETKYVIWRALEDRTWQVLTEIDFITITGGTLWQFLSHTTEK